MNDKKTEKIILDALNEDLLPNGDITSDALISENKKSKFNLITNENAIVSGIEVFKKCFLLINKNILIKNNFNDGDEIKKGQIVVSLFGNTKAILKSERTALNFICHLSGISTITKTIVDLIKTTNTELLDTRKTMPNLRLFEKNAVLAGGGKNHRFNLSSMVLIKDNHIDNYGSVSKAINKIKAKYKKKYKIEVEVRNITELKEAISLKPNIIMFDNWRVNELKEALKLVPSNIKTEVSGQISIDNVKDYAECGINFISTSYMIKNARWIDFSLEAERHNEI